MERGKRASFLIIFLALQFKTTKQLNSLNGKHLVVSGLSNPIIGFGMVRNESGHIVRAEGMAAHMINWLSEQYNFTYSILQTNETRLDPGLIGHLIRNDCQLLFSVVATRSRTIHLDFSQPNIYIPVSYLIPKPVSSANLASISYSFQTPVWIGLIISIMGTIALFHWFRRFIKITYIVEHLATNSTKTWNAGCYVFGVLLGQGGYLPFKSRPFYIIGATWCFAAFVLVNSYNCTLISFLTSPKQQLLINSIYDLRDRPDIHLVSDRNLNTDAVLLSAESGFLKELGDKLKAHEEDRCNTTKECINLVKSGNHVYTSGIPSFLYGAIRDDYEATGKCNFYMKPEPYMQMKSSLVIRKKSTGIHMNEINMGIMRLMEVGLMDVWIAKYQPNPRQCLVKTKPSLKSLELRDLQIVIAILLFGSILAFVFFIGEQITFHTFSRKKRTSKVSTIIVETK